MRPSRRQWHRGVQVRREVDSATTIGFVRAAVVAGLCVAVLVACAPTREASRPAAAGASQAATLVADTGEFTIPPPTGFVNDFAHVLTAADAAALDTLAREVRAKSHGEIAVVTLASLHGQPIRDVATRIGNSWGIGYKGAPDDPATNTGVIVLLAPNEHRVWIGTADGARVFLTDSTATSISRSMTPAFQAGSYGPGLRLGVGMIAHAFARRFHFTLTTADSSRSGVE